MADKKPGAIEKVLSRIYTGAAIPFSDIFLAAEKGGGDVFRGSKVLNKEQGFNLGGIDQFPAIVNDIAKAFGARTNIPYLEKASTRMQEGEAALRKVTKTAAPSNPMELAQELGGSVLVGIPSAGRRVAAEGVKRSAPKVAADIAKGAGKVVAETVLPFRQTGLRTAVTAAPALGVGLTEAVDYAGDVEEYSGIADAAKDFFPSKAVMEKPLAAYIDPELMAEIDAADDLTPYQEVLEAADQERQLEAVEADMPPEPSWKAGLLTAAALTATGLGAYGVNRFMKSAAQKMLKPADNLSGVEFKREYSHLGDKIVEGAIQSDQVVRSAGKELYQGKSYEQFKADLDGITAPSLNSKAQHTMATGQWTNSSVTSKPLAAVLDAFAGEVDQAEWQVIVDGMLARNALDDLRLTGSQAAFNDLTPAQLQAKVDLVTNDPKLSKYDDLIKEQYRTVLDYSLDRGLVSQADHAAMIAARPNYVHMSRNLATQGNDRLIFGRGIGANEAEQKRMQLFKRSDEEWGGVQAGAAADPIRELPAVLTNIVRQAEVNDVKRKFLEEASGNAALKDFVRRIPDGEQPNTLEGIHEIREAGKIVRYKVSDPALAQSLDFMPFAARDFWSTALGVPKKLKENFTTGAGAPLFAPVSAFYDTVTGLSLRPKGYDVGLINEFKNNLLGANQGPVMGAISEGLSRLDPTAWLSAPIGAVRLAGDTMVQSLAHDLSVRLLKDNDWVVGALGKQNMTVLRDRMASMYDASVKSIMDEYGATTSNYLGGQDLNGMAKGIVDLAPKFYSEASKRAYNEAVEGGADGFTKALMMAGSAAERARAAGITRLYMGTVKLLHEGFRYQTAATNLPKVIGDEELKRIWASQTRRISADIGQTGSAQAYQQLARSALYLNVGVQTLAEVGRKFKAQPATTLTNMSSVLGALLVAQYGYAAMDPANAEEVRKLADDQQTRIAKTFAGTELPIPPELRMAWGPITAIMNEITGINSGQMNPDFVGAFEAWMDGGFELNELAQASLKESNKAARDSTSPLNIGSFPMANAAAAGMGFDIGLTRFTESPKNIEGQKLSLAEGEGKLMGDALSAKAQKMILEVLGTTVSDLTRAGLDAERALGIGYGYDQATDVAMSRMMDNTVKAAGPVRGMIFGGYERVQSVNDTEFKLWYKKKEGIDKATTTLNQEVLQHYVTGADPRYAMLRDIDTIEPVNTGTALVPVGVAAANLKKDIDPLNKRMNTIKEQIENVRNSYAEPVAIRNMKENDLNKERLALAAQMLFVTEQYEEFVRMQLGDPKFTFQNFDPVVYKDIPWQPPIPPSQDNAAPTP